MTLQIERNPTTGKIIAKRFTLEEIEEASANDCGFCLACGAERENCEPGCAEIPLRVLVAITRSTGAEEIALMGLLK